MMTLSRGLIIPAFLALADTTAQGQVPQPPTYELPFPPRLRVDIAPGSIEDAVAEVQAITDPDPHQQDRLRAEATLQIVRKRVSVINTFGGKCLQVMPLDVGKTKTKAEALDIARAKGWDLARSAWLIGGGACDEHASLMQAILKLAGVENVIILRSGSPHAFPVIDLAPDADPDIPWTWGPDAFVADSWAGKIVAPSEAWDNSLYFAGGEQYVFSGQREKNTTREKLKLITQRGASFINQHCDEYLPLIAKFKMIPSEIRARMTFKPLGETCPITTISTCTRWNISGRWQIIQSNGYKPVFDLRQNGNHLEGQATLGATTAPVTGSLINNQFNVLVTWSNNSQGRYAGTVSPGMISNGESHDEAHPGSRANWSGTGPATCVP